MTRFATLAELAAKLAEAGSRPALVAFRESGPDTMTYAQLGRAIERLAIALTARGLGANARIALCAPSSPQWVIAYFAIVRAGAVAVPLDHQSTPQQTADLLRHARPGLLLTTAARLEDLSRAAGAPTLLLDDVAQWESASSTEHSARLPHVAPEQAAALIYTSGTTGSPKGVLLSHRNLAANAAALVEAKLVRSSDRVLLPLPLHHTYPFTVGLVLPLATRAAVIFPAGISGPQLGQAGRDGGATALLAVPKLCDALWEGVRAQAASRGRHSLRAFLALLAVSSAVRRATGLRLGKWLFRPVHRQMGPALRLIGCGGAKLGEDLARRLEALGWTIRTGYGLTETSPVVTFNSPYATHLGSEGRPLPGVEVRIESPDPRQAGEIVVRGPSVFAGYVDNEAATANAFTPDGWFRTGDLGYVDARGFLHVVGRSKELIVLPDGKKLFPEDVEKHYAASELLREIAVLEHGGALAALIVPNEDAVRRRGALRESALLRETVEDAAAQLPPYQRIAEYRVTRSPLPRTQLGKLRRHLLPALYRDAAVERPAAAELAAGDRELLASDRGRAVWEWLAARFPERPLTPDTSPQLDLGIDSLAWVALTIEIEQRFGAALDGDAVSRILTLRDLLREIERAQTAPAPSRRAPAASFAPQELWLRAAGTALYALARTIMRAAFRLRVRGLEQLPHDVPLVIAPNHASYLDPLAIAAALPWRRLKRTYWAGWVGIMYTGTVSSFVSRATRVLPIDPDRDLAHAIDMARDALRQGYSIVWFPEGRRSPNGELGTFLPGIDLLLADGTVSAIPTAIHGTFAAWPRHRRRPRLGGTIDVTFGEPRRAQPGAAAVYEQLEADVRTLLRDGARDAPDNGAG